MIRIKAREALKNFNKNDKRFRIRFVLSDIRAKIKKSLKYNIDKT